MRSNSFYRSMLTLLLVSVPLAGIAQRTTATFAGIVQDPSGAVLPGATVELTNEGTNAVMSKVTSETGDFLFDYVPVGNYTLKAMKRGVNHHFAALAGDGC